MDGLSDGLWVARPGLQVADVFCFRTKAWAGTQGSPVPPSWTWVGQDPRAQGQQPLGWAWEWGVAGAGLQAVTEGPSLLTQDLPLDQLSGGTRNVPTWCPGGPWESRPGLSRLGS